MAGVDPFGKIYATVANNGRWMGNRGNLRKNGASSIVRQWETRRWIYCICEGERIDVCYTKLFFIDEATALAAGHRPCKTCLSSRYKSFKAAWIIGNPEHGLGDNPDIDSVDKILDSERKTEEKGKRTFRAQLGTLPEGVIVTVDGGGDAFLYRKGKLHRWTPMKYDEEIVADVGMSVTVLTPRSIVNAIRAGFKVSEEQDRI